MPYDIEIADIENYYADLLIIQYRNKPNARATIKLGVDLYLADGLIFDLNNVLDIDTAVGAQLDLIGKILGVNRQIDGFTLDHDYFSFEKEPPAVSYGYSDKDALSQGYWKNYNNSIGSSYSLNDDDYRVLLKFKALYNVRYGSWGCMDLLYWRTFGNEITLVNNKDLTVSYQVSPSASIGLQVAQYLGYIEPPLGIGIDNP